MSNSMNFVELGESAGPDSGQKRISKKRMDERLREALRHRGGSLDDEEQDSFVNFCFRAVATNKDKKALRPSSSGLFDLLGVDRQRSEEEMQEHINIDCFNKACSSLDKMRFEAVVELFDRDRRIRPLETFFMPK